MATISETDLGDSCAPWTEPRVSVKCLLTNAADLGVPGFQRGSVWPDGSVGGLLRSLSLGYFVGTVLIWRPLELPAGWARLAARGVPRHLLLDGQQRVRALLSSLLPPMPDRSTGRIVGALWCVRRKRGGGLEFAAKTFSDGRQAHRDWLPLILLPSVRACSQGSPVADYQPRRRVEGSDEQVDQGAPVSLQAPVSWLLRFSADADMDGLDADLQRLVEACIDVRVLVETGARWRQGEVIDNYRRINDSGSQLSDEEREFARLVAITGTGVSTSLQSVFDHRVGGSEDTKDAPPRDPEDDAVGSRAEWLKRGDEREFGLALLIRAVRLARDIHSGLRVESNAPIGEVREGRARGWIDDAEQSINAISRALRALKCDDRSRIPRRRSAFGLLLGVLLRFPPLREDNEWANTHVQMLTLGFFLRPDERVTVKGDSPEDVIFDATDARDAVDRLRGWLDAQMGDEERAVRLWLYRDLTLSGRYVQLLYWWLRSQGARDICKDETGGPTDGDLLSATLTPERQHIVPFTRVEFTTNPAPRRSTGHLVNSIGNLTWISRVSNSFEVGGWSNTFMRASQHAAGTHLLHGFDSIRREDSANVAESDLAAFVDARATRLTRAFLRWWGELRDQSRAAGEAPATRAVPRSERRPCVLDTLAGWGYPPQLARLVARLLTPGSAWLVEHRSSAQGWRRGDRTRLRRAERVTEAYWAGPLKFEVRGPGETESRRARLVLEASRVLVPVDRDGDGQWHSVEDRDEISEALITLMEQTSAVSLDEVSS